MALSFLFDFLLLVVIVVTTAAAEAGAIDSDIGRLLVKVLDAELLVGTGGSVGLPLETRDCTPAEAVDLADFLLVCVVGGCCCCCC